MSIAQQRAHQDYERAGALEGETPSHGGKAEEVAQRAPKESAANTTARGKPSETTKNSIENLGKNHTKPLKTLALFAEKLHRLSIRGPFAAQVS